MQRIPINPVHIAALLFVGYIMTYSQSQNFKFTHITTAEGLPQNTVSSIFQDSQGFMWFGTLEGLCKYDGYRVINYSHDQFNANSISDNLVNDIFETQESGEKVLWIVTSNGGLDKFYVDKEKFVPCPQHKECNLYYLQTIAGDNFNSLWMGSGNGLVEMKIKDNSFYKYKLDDKTGNDDNIYRKIICLDGNNLLLVNATHGIYSFDVRTKKFSEIVCLSEIFKDINIMDCVREPGNDNVFWIGTTEHGLFRFDSKSKELKNYRFRPNNNLSLGHDYVSSLLIDQSSSLWIGHLNSGISIINTHDWKKEKFIRIKYDPNNSNSLSNDAVDVFMQDRSGLIWIGTNGGGLNIYNPKTIQFSHINFNPKNDNTILDNSVWSIYETNNSYGNFLWIGSNLGLTSLNRNTNEYTRYKNDPDDPGSISKYSVRSMLLDSKGRFWIGILNGGIDQFDFKKKKFKHIYENLEIENGLISDEIYKIYEDTDKNIWIGANDYGLQKFEPGKVRFTHLPNRSGGIYYSWATTVFKDENKTVWIGTWLTGLIGHTDNGNGKIIQFRNIPGDAKSLSNDIVFAIHESKRSPGILWIGTYGGGLNMFDTHKKIFKAYTERDGLSNNCIYAMLEDDNGFLWLSTNKGLSRFDPVTFTFKNYNTDNGLANLEFNLGAAFKSPKGELFFGGVNGVDYFIPDYSINEMPPSILITAFKKFGQKVTTSQSVDKLNKIELAYNENFIGFEFVALHYVNSKRNLYSYKLENFDKGWSVLGIDRQASYTNVPPGEYIFKIKAANSDGIWSGVKSISVVINPPYWKTWWFLILLILALIFILSIIYKLRVRHILNLNKIKTEERLKVQKKIATDFHDELGHRITSIVYRARNINSGLNNSNGIDKDLESIIANASQLNEEMRQVVWEMDPQKESLYDLVVNLKRFYDELFDEDEIAFTINGLTDEFESVILPMNWRQNLSRIFKEALHNIKKHAKGCRYMSLSVSLHQNELEIMLQNDGTGFDTGLPANGYGLSNMKDRAQKLGASLKIESNIKNGTKIIFHGILSQETVI